MHRDDDEAWRAIVDNYGDRPQIDDHDPVPDATPDAVADEGVDTEGEQDADDFEDRAGPVGARGDREPGATWDQQSPDSDWTTDRFVPPPPPPVPTTTADRYVAWAGVFGSPVVLLLSLVLGIELPELIAYLLVIGFIGGFLYLVVRMDRDPRDPGDDGARL